MNQTDPLLRLFARFREEGVEYVLVGGQAVRLNGFLRATEDIDILVKPTRENGERIIRALDFLESSRDLEPEWFIPSPDGEVENIRVADDLLIDLLFAANGETLASVQPHVREVLIDGTPIKVLDIDGLLKTKTDYREKDLLDRQALLRIQRNLNRDQGVRD
jgi:hypothetical protein